MHLDSLTLIGVRQFKRQTFYFRPGFNLLVGENGAGKTTILRGLLAAMASSRQRGSSFNLQDSDIGFGARRAEVSAVVRSGNEFKEFSFYKELWKPAERTKDRKSAPLVLLYSSSESICSALKAKRGRLVRELVNDPSRGSEEFLYAAEERVRQRTAVDRSKKFGNSRSVRDFVGKVLSTFSPGMGDFYWRFEPYDCSLVANEGSGKRPRFEAEVRTLARDIAMRYFQQRLIRRGRNYSWPDQPKIVLAPDSHELDLGQRGIPSLKSIWQNADMPSEAARRYLMSCSLEVKLAPRIMIRRRIGALPLSQLSDGEQRLFSLFVDIARQLSIRNEGSPLGEGEGIVLIDEIDVHLHPKWQRKIVPALEDLFSGCQFIATTHSPFVIQATQRNQVTSIDPASAGIFLHGGESIEDIAENIQGIDQPQRSARSETLSKAAEKYFSLLQIHAVTPTQVRMEDLQLAELRYREASEPFTSDSAVSALLKVMKLERQAP